MHQRDKVWQKTYNGLMTNLDIGIHHAGILLIKNVLYKILRQDIHVTTEIKLPSTGVT